MIDMIPSEVTIIKPEPEDDGYSNNGYRARVNPRAVPIDIRVPRKFGPLLSAMIGRGIRSRPSYSDVWRLEPPEGLQTLAAYDSRWAGVNVGEAPDGECEYDITPIEYTLDDALNSIVGGVITDIRDAYREEGGSLDRDAVRSRARKMLSDRLADTEQLGPLETAMDGVCDAVYRHTAGLGVLEVLLSDPHIEDVYIDAPCGENRIYVTMNGIEGVNSHMRCRTNLMADEGEVSNLINILKRSSGLRYCQTSPVLETDLPGFDARATVVGYPMSPKGDAVAIRKRSDRQWTLPRLIMNGTVDAKTAGLLSYLVDNRCTMLICGARGSGKSSMLSALMFELPPDERIITIEDTLELPGEHMRRLGYKVQTILVDDRMSGDQLSRSNEALRLSLRMGESAIVLGEVRGEEARTLYQSMRTGRAGSSIMGTVHGDSARSVYDRMVHDLDISPESFMATDVIVTLGTVKDRRTGNLVRRVGEVVHTAGPGEFSDMTDSERMFRSPVMVRSLRTNGTDRSEAAKEIRARGMMRAALAEFGRTDERYLRPEWIMAANDEIAKADRSKTAEGMAESFRERLRAGAMPWRPTIEDSWQKGRRWLA